MASSTARSRPSLRGLSSAGRLSLLSQRTPRVAARMSRLHARAYRLTGGKGLGRWFSAPLVVLETVGRRSGKLRRTPVIYLERGEDIVVMAANGGSDRTPAWWLNLREAGRGVAILHSQRREIVPRLVDGEERAELWTAFAEMYPAIDEYTTFSDRNFPLVVLSPAP